MALDPAQLVTLKAELDSTYSGQTNGTVAVAINDRDGPNKITDFQIENVSNVDAVAAVVVSEFILLTDAQQRGWLMVTGLERIPVKNAAIRSLIQDIWGAPTTTRANLIALQTRDGSHAEDLFGQRASIDDIRAARLV